MCYKMPDHRFLKKVNNYLYCGYLNIDLFYCGDDTYGMFKSDRTIFWRWIGAA